MTSLNLYHLLLGPLSKYSGSESFNVRVLGMGEETQSIAASVGCTCQLHLPARICPHLANPAALGSRVRSAERRLPICTWCYFHSAGAHLKVIHPATVLTVTPGNLHNPAKPWVFHCKQWYQVADLTDLWGGLKAITHAEHLAPFERLLGTGRRSAPHSSPCLHG